MTEVDASAQRNTDDMVAIAAASNHFAPKLQSAIAHKIGGAPQEITEEVFEAAGSRFRLLCIMCSLFVARTTRENLEDMLEMDEESLMSAFDAAYDQFVDELEDDA